MDKSTKKKHTHTHNTQSNDKFKRRMNKRNLRRFVDDDERTYTNDTIATTTAAIALHVWREWTKCKEHDEDCECASVSVCM